jgi:hypothetical protein
VDRQGIKRMSDLSRRIFLRWLLGFALLPTFPFSVRKADAQGVSPTSPEGRRSIVQFFKGEELEYQIGVGPFKRVALGRLNFKPLGRTGRYLATLQAETLGVLGWVARYRVDTYRATMEEIDGGKRLRALSFEEDVKIGNKLRRKISLFDYQRRKWIKVRRRKDGTMGKAEEDIPPGVIYDDFLTASYNFRYGVYGEIARGKKYSVTTFPRKVSSTYEVIVAGREEEEKRRRSDKAKEGKEFFVKLYLDPEITHSKEGLIEGWLSKEFYPLEGAIKDVFFYGDVRGSLIKNSRR